VWNVKVADYNPGFNYTAGPLIVKDMVIAGISGCTTPDTGGGCFLTAHDAETGKELWRLHTIARPDDPNDATWTGIPLQERKGGSMWGPGAYDPELNLIYWGVAPPIPHSELARGTPESAHLYTNSTLAIDPDTGKIVWYFQHLPSDNWNLDHAFERVLVDVGDGDEVKKILLTVGKTGIVWALDRKTGKYLWSTETVPQNVISNIDSDGKITLNEAMKPKELDVDYLACPSLYGGKIWQATAYNQRPRRCTCRSPACVTTIRSWNSRPRLARISAAAGSPRAMPPATTAWSAASRRWTRPRASRSGTTSGGPSSAAVCSPRTAVW